VLWVLALDGADDGTGDVTGVPAEGVGCAEDAAAADGGPLAAEVGEDAAFPAVVCVEDVVEAP